METQENRTPLTHEIRRGFLSPIHSRIRALQAAMIQVIKERITEWKAAGMGTRIGIESQIILSSDDYDTFTIIAVDLNKDGSPIAIVEEDMGSNETNSGLEYLSIDLLAQIIDDLRIEIPNHLLPVAEPEADYQQILKAFKVARDTAEALKDQLLEAVAMSQGLAEPNILVIDLVEPLSDQELEALYGTGKELEEIINFKDNTDSVECFATFTARAEEVGYRHLFTYDRIDYFIR